MITRKLTNCYEAYGRKKPLGISQRFQSASTTLHILFDEYVERGWWSEEQGWMFDDPTMSDADELRNIKKEFFEAADELSELRRRHLLRKCGWNLVSSPSYGVVRISDGCSLYL